MNPSTAHFCIVTTFVISFNILPTIMPKTDEGATLGHASFWDERYSKADDSSKPTHEWFRDFASLEPFLSKHLFTVRQPDSKPRILHLGSGDSVGRHSFQISNRLCWTYIDGTIWFASPRLWRSNMSWLLCRGRRSHEITTRLRIGCRVASRRH